MKYLGWFGLALALAGCGSEAIDPVEPPGEGGGGGGGAAGSDAVPRIAFVSRDSGAEVGELRYGEPFFVRAEGMPQGKVTLASALWGYRGSAEFSVADDGTIDTSRDAPTDGSYSGVHAEGLLWSMELMSMEQGTEYGIDIEARVDGAPVVQARLERPGLNTGLVEEQINESGLVGVVFKPEDAQGPLPALMIMGGSEGGIDSARFRAAWLAGYGYTAFGLAYHGMPGLPPEIEEIPLEYFQTALEWLAARPDVVPDRIGVLGGSRGGELVLMLGAEFPQVRAVIAEVPSGVRWGATSFVDTSGWSQGGMPLPYLGSGATGAPVPETLPDGSTAYRLTPVFEEILASSTPAELDAATILVEQTNGAVLLLAGADDGIWPSCTLAQIAFDRLVRAGHDAMYDDAVHCFADSGHSAATPGWPTTGSYAGFIGPTQYVFGGTPEGTAESQREGLDLIRAFLDANLAP
jgi:dienelactone hydrolase